MRFILILTVLLMFISCTQPGYRGIPWGADFDDVKDMLVMPCVASTAYMKAYTMKGDDFAIEGVKVDSVAYYFYNNSLHQIIAVFDDVHTLNEVTAELMKKYGDHPEKNADGSYVWTAEKYGMYIRLSYDWSDNSGYAAFERIDTGGS